MSFLTSAKYNRQNGELLFSIKRLENLLIIRVEDTGIGMSEEEQSCLFQEFMRAKNENTKNISGTGLGLSIMKKFIDLNKVTVQVQSTLNIGTIFTVQLPIIN